jgi:hypothetical protein
MEGQIITPGRVALRHFKPTYVGSGSKNGVLSGGRMSASTGSGHAVLRGMGVMCQERKLRTLIQRFRRRGRREAAGR